LKRFAIITTHPIQYNAPVFAMLAARAKIEVKIFYTWGKEVLKDKYDPGFGKIINWDIPLLEGYNYAFVENGAIEKGSHHFKGIDNPHLIDEIEAWKADAVLVYGWSFKSHLKVMRHFKGKLPVYFRGDSTLLNSNNFFKGFIRKNFLRWVYSFVNKAFYVGTYNKQYFLAAGLKKNNLIFAPHAIDNYRFYIQSNAGVELSKKIREEFKIEESAIVFLYAGKLDANKNIISLIQAFLALNHPQAHLLIAGDGEKKKSLIELAGTNKAIHFLPFQNQQNMPILYGACDVFVLPSINETWGLSINEAMACQKAIIASKGCAASIDLVNEGVNGYLFDTGIDGMLEAVLKKCCDAGKNSLKIMGGKSFEHIQSWNYLHICTAIENEIIG